MYPLQEFLFWISILFILYYSFIFSVIFIKRRKEGNTDIGKDILKIDNEINKELIKLGLEKAPAPSHITYDEEVDKIKKINDEINKINSELTDINKNRLKPYEKKESACYKIQEERAKAKCSADTKEVKESEMSIFQKLMSGVKKDL